MTFSAILKPTGLGLLLLLGVGCGLQTDKNPLAEKADRLTTRTQQTAGDVKALDLSLVPPAVELAPGDSFSFVAHSIQSTGAASDSPAGVVFTSSDPAILESQGDGKFLAKALGTATVSATAGSTTATATAKVATPAACTALTAFHDNVEPVLDAKCALCHANASNPGNAAFPIAAPAAAPSAADAVKANWAQAKDRIDAKQIMESKILKKVSGGLPHAGGALLAISSPEFSALANWANDEAKCLNTVVFTSLSLSPNAATVKAGSKLALKAVGADATGKAQPITVALDWRMEVASATAPLDYGTMDTAGNLTVGQHLGTFKIIAKMGSLEGSSDITVVAPAALPEVPTCVAYNDYKKQVEPILQASCVSCHGDGGIGSSAMAILGPKPSDQDLLVNHAELVQRLNLSAAKDSKLLSKVTGGSSHGGAKVLAADSNEYGQMAAWAEGESLCFNNQMASLEVTPVDQAITAGQTLQLKAIVVNKNGSSSEVKDGVIWGLQAAKGGEAIPAGISLSDSGLLTANAAGNVKVTAKLGDIVAMTNVTVVPRLVQGVASITITPATLNLYVNSVQQMKLRIIYADGSEASADPGIVWTSSDDTVATIAENVVTAKKVGTAQLTASLSGKSATAGVSVLGAAQCSSFASFTTTIQPVIEQNCSTCHGVGGSQAFLSFALTPAATCAARFANWANAKSELTFGNLLASKFLQKPTVKVSHGGGLQLTGTGPDVFMAWMNEAISCHDTNNVVESGALEDICPKVAVAIEVSPEAYVIKVDDQITLAATVTYDDTTISTTDPNVSWTIDDPNHIAQLTGSTIKGIKSGLVTVTANIGSLKKSVSVTIQSKAVVLTSLEVTTPPASTASLYLGTTLTLKLTGHYSDGTSVDQTTGVTWTSGDTTKATVSATSGVLTPKAAGTVFVTGKLATCALADCTAAMTETVIGVASIVLNPATQSILIGGTQAISAVVTYTDTPPKTLTNPAGIVFTSSATSKATVSGNVVKGVAAGTATITATFGGKTSTSAFTVNLPPNCPSFATYRQAVAPLLTACGNCHGGTNPQASDKFAFAGGSTVCTAQVVDWRAARTEIDGNSQAKSNIILKPSNAIPHGGGLFFSSTQTKTMTDWVNIDVACNAAGVSDSNDMDVLCPKVATGIAVTPTAPDIQMGKTLAMKATVTYDNGSPSDTDPGVTWTSSNSSVATVSSAGVITGLSSGTTNIVAHLGTLSSSVAATVRAADIVITRLDITPASQSVPVGDTVTFETKATYSDNTTKTLGSEVTWTSSIPGNATISATGVVTGKAIAHSADGKTIVNASTLTSTLKTTCTNGNGGVIANCPASAKVKVIAPSLKSISIDPPQAILVTGISKKFEVIGTYSDGNKVPITSGVTWTTDDASLLLLDAVGNVTPRGVGYGQITATFGAYTMTAGILTQPSGCNTADQFQSSVDPVLQTYCVSCHGLSGNLGNSSLPMKGPNPTAFEVNANLDQLRMKVNSTNVLASLVLVKPLGGLTHGGGAIFSSATNTHYLAIKSWATAEAACIKANIPTNLTRNSGEVLYLRLAQLFPTATTATPPLLKARDFDMFYSTGLDRVLANTERMFSPVVQIALRAKVNALCTKYVDAADATNNLFAWNTSTLKAGESVPTDAKVKIALAAARNGWLYPYTATSHEVQDLVALYTNALAVTGTTTLKAKQVVCAATLSAPQFLFGNAGDNDAVRRLSLESGRTVPTMADYDAYAAATDKKAFLKSMLDTLQTKSGYMTAVKSWHRDWLGLRDYYDVGRGQTRPEAAQGIGGGNTGMGLSGVPITGLSDVDAGFNQVDANNVPVGVQTTLRAVELNIDRNSPTQADFSEQCKGVEQNFDPRTTEIYYEQKNKLNGNWEKIGGAKKLANGTWQPYTGWITTAVGTGGGADTTKVTSLADITPVSLNGDSQNCYKTGGLVGTPMECFDGTRHLGVDANGKPTVQSGKQYMQRRLRRISPSGEQNGFSKVKLWYSGEEVHVCNTITRFVTSCAYRPPTATPVEATLTPVSGGINYDEGKVLGFSTDIPWNFGINNRPKIGPPSLRDSFASPLVLDNYRCGSPDTAQIELMGGDAYNENLAYPRGYAAMTGAIDQSLLNDKAMNPTDFFGRQLNGNLDMTISNNLAAKYGEDQAVGRLLQDLQAEPLTLVQKVVSANADYRLLLTAPYTYGRTEMELLYRSSDYYLPALPPGYTAKTGAANVVAKITQASVQPIPLSWMRNTAGTYGVGLGANYFKDELAAGAVVARPMSGILTQSAFVGPVSVNSGKLRSISARVYQRLLCGLPSDFLSDLDGNAMTLHESYVSTKESNGKAHLDKSRGCYNCHVNLDPLASSMKLTFKTDPSTAAVGEMKYAPFMGVPNVYGFRGGTTQGVGALFGTRITGIKEMASVLASSKQFSQCVVKTAFQNVFGRLPIGDEMGLIHDVAVSFQGPLNYDYNAMIDELVTSDAYKRRN